MQHYNKLLATIWVHDITTHVLAKIHVSHNTTMYNRKEDICCRFVVEKKEKM